MQKSTQKKKVEPSGNGTSVFLAVLMHWSWTNTYQHGSYWGCDDDTYRFLEEDGTAWTSSARVDRGIHTRPSPFSKTAKKGWAHLHDADKTSTVEDHTTRLSPSSLRPVSFKYDTISGHTPTRFATTSTRPGVERWFVMVALPKSGQDAIQSRVLHPSDDLPRTLSWKIGPDSQTRMQSFAGGNVSRTGDQIWGTLRASPGTHFPDSLQKPLLAHVDPHAETQRTCRDQQHQQPLPRIRPPG